MTHPSLRNGTAVATGALTLTLTLALAACSPQPAEPTADDLAPIRALDIVVGRQDRPVEVDVDGGDDGVQVAVHKVTVTPGSGIGEHCHHGQLVAVVEKGELTHYADVYPGGVHVYRAGDSIVESARYIHKGINEGTEDLEMTITYITPEGKPLSEMDLTQCEE